MKSFIAYLIVLAFPLACGGNADKETFLVEDALPASKEMQSLSAAPNSNLEVVDEATKIIREASLRFETQDLNTTYRHVLSVVKKHQASLQNDMEGKEYDAVYKTLTIRIPNKHFDAFLDEIGKEVRYFDRKEISSRDVTAEFIDLSARLKAKKTLEARYLDLLKKAVKVSEILEIEKELSIIREEIEAKQGQLNYLQNKVSLSTIRIEFYKKLAKEEHATVSYGTKMWRAIQSGWNAISGFFIGLLHIWPFLLLLGAIGVYIRKKMKRKNQ